MTEELNLLAIQEETTIRDQATIANKGEKKTKTMVDKTEDSTTTRKTEKIEVQAKTIDRRYNGRNNYYGNNRSGS